MTIFHTVNKRKGGSGATTEIFNEAKYLQKQGKRVIMADFDVNLSLTRRFIPEKEHDQRVKPENDVTHLFKKDGNPIPLQVDENIWLFPGNPELALMTNEIMQGMGRKYVLIWVAKHLKEIQEKYDYFLIDTHNDGSIITENALVVANKVINIVDVDGDSMEQISEVINHVEALKGLEVNPITLETFVNAEVVVVGNKIKYVGEDSRKFKEDFELLMEKKPEMFLGYFHERAIMAKTKTANQSIFDLKEEPRYQDASHRAFFQEAETVFHKITGV